MTLHECKIKQIKTLTNHNFLTFNGMLVILIFSPYFKIEDKIKQIKALISHKFLVFSNMSVRLILSHLLEQTFFTRVRPLCCYNPGNSKFCLNFTQTISIHGFNLTNDFKILSKIKAYFFYLSYAIIFFTCIIFLIIKLVEQEIYRQNTNPYKNIEKCHKKHFMQDVEKINLVKIIAT